MQETVKLSGPESPLRIEYAKPAMEQIRMRARDGLMAAPRIGMSVGGLLLGVRHDSRILVLNSIELPCSHSTGPSFTLTPEEKQESRDLVAEANALSAASKVGVIGWYCSKTRGDAVLSTSDLNLFAELLPGAGQIALVLRPDIFESMRAAFFYRDAGGEVVKAFECDVDEWRPAPATEAAPDTEAEVPAPQPVVPEEPRPDPPKVVEIRTLAPKTVEAVEPAALKPASATLEDIIGLATSEAPVKPVAAASQAMFFDAPPVKRKFQIGKRLLMAMGAALVLVLALVAYFTRDAWLPRPPLSLTFSELDGSLLIHWDPEAVRGIEHASMYVNDGGEPSPEVIPLDRLELNAGLLSYTPKSKRITAKLAAGTTSAINTWFAPEKAATENPPADTPAPEANPAGISTGDNPAAAASPTAATSVETPVGAGKK